MYRFLSKKGVTRKVFFPSLWILSALVLVVVLSGCGGGSTPQEPEPILIPVSNPSPREGFLPTATLDAASTSEPATGAEDNPAIVTASQSESTDALLELWSPLDGTETKTGVVRLTGKAQIDAAVAVNGIPLDVASDGTFQRDLLLQEGANLIEVAATDLWGKATYQNVAVFSTASSGGLPLSLFYPPDGLEVREPKVTVMGGTRQDAIVGVNGVPVGLNALGIFSTVVPLDEGANLIEIVTTDIQEKVDYQTVVVFYLR